MANLRMIYNNVADSATVSATSVESTFVAANAQKDTKGLVWRTATAVTTATYTLTWASGQNISAVVLPFTNLSSTATVVVKLYTGAYTLFSTSSPVLVKGSLSTWNTQTLGSNTYSYGGGSCVAVWLANSTSITRVEIVITDAGNPSSYLEVSRVVCGTYWSPTYNVPYGIQVGFNDLSDQIRTQAGNLVTNNSTFSKTINFDLSYMNIADRDIFIQILRINGKRLPVFVSVFPEDTSGNTESIYQIYGKITDLATISHPMFTMYASSVSIAEV